MNPDRSAYRPAHDFPTPDFRTLSAFGPVIAACIKLASLVATIAIPFPATDDAIHPAIRDLANKAQVDPEAENRYPDLVEALREFDELVPDTVAGQNAVWVLPEDRTPEEREAVEQLRTDLRTLEQSGIIRRIEELIAHPNLANTYAGGLRADGSALPALYWTHEELGIIRTFVTLQVTIAKLALQDGRLEAAADILHRSCHAARYMTRQPLIIEHLVGFACASVINEAAVEVATDPRVDLSTISRLRAANQILQNLGGIEIPMEGERLLIYDMQNQLHNRRGDLIASRLISASSADESLRSLSLYELIRNPVPTALSLIAPSRDLNIGVTNVLFRLLDDAHRTPDPDERKRLLRLWEDKLYEIRLNVVAVSIFMPALDRTIEVTTRIDAAIHATSIILAMAEYRLDHAEWPQTLDQLVPDYLDAVPISTETGLSFEYSHTPGETPSLESFGFENEFED